MNNLPQTREEYTLWCLSMEHSFRQEYQSMSYLSLHTWIEYTINNFPDLVTVEDHRGAFMSSIKVSICGIAVDNVRPQSISYSACRKLLGKRGINETTANS